MKKYKIIPKWYKGLKARYLKGTHQNRQIACLAKTSTTEAAKQTQEQKVQRVFYLKGSKVKSNINFLDPKKLHLITASDFIENLPLHYKEVRQFDGIASDLGNNLICPEIIEPSTGIRYKYDYEKNKYIKQGKLKPSIFLNFEAECLYNAIQAVIHYHFERPEILEDFTLRAIEASISYNQISRCYESCFEDFNILLKSNVEILIFFWTHFKKDSMEIVTIADDLKDAIVTTYTGGVPPFKQIKKVEEEQLCQQFLHTLFNGVIPRSIDNQRTKDAFMRSLILRTAITKEHFRKKMEMAGLAFSDVFAQIEEGAHDVKLLPYSKDTFVMGHISKSSYAKPKFIGNTIMLTTACKTFLENLCIGDPYIYSAIRGSLRTLITNKLDGKDYQTALWLCGPPGCSKTKIVELFKKFTSPDKILEWSHEANQFTGGTFLDKALIVLSDITDITASEYKILKPLLGRDSISGMRKYQPDAFVVDPHATILCISNKPPTEISFIKNDPAVLDKLIVVKYPPEAAIPANLQMADFGRHFDRFVPEIFNWAVYTPTSVLRNHTRALMYNGLLLKRQDPESIGGLPGYLREHCLWSKDPQFFIPVANLRLHIEQYETATGEDILGFLKRNGKSNLTGFHNFVVNTVNRSFGRTIQYKRYTKRDLNPRPIIFSNIFFKKDIEFKDKDMKVPPDGFEFFEFKAHLTSVQLDDPFYTEQRICWLRSDSSSDEYFDKQQEALKTYRENMKYLSEVINDSPLEISEEMPELSGTSDTDPVLDQDDSFSKEGEIPQMEKPIDVLPIEDQWETAFLQEGGGL